MAVEGEQRQAENNFEKAAREWWSWWSVGKSPRHAETVLRRLETDVSPAYGHKPIDMVTATDIRKLMLAVAGRGARHVAKRPLRHNVNRKSRAALQNADVEFHREMVGIAHSFRNYSLEKPPSVSEITTGAHECNHDFERDDRDQADQPSELGIHRNAYSFPHHRIDSAKPELRTERGDEKTQPATIGHLVLLALCSQFP
jgi:hypothetical protein